MQIIPIPNNIDTHTYSVNALCLSKLYMAEV